MSDPTHDPESIRPGDPPYPIDVAALTRGQDITMAECIDILGIQPEDKRWPFAMLMVTAWIIHESAALGSPLSVCQRKGGIHINTDSEASVYHARNAGKHEDGIRRNFTMLCKTVRADDLNEIQRLDHAQSVKLWALKVAALRGARITAPMPTAQAT